MGRVKNLLTAVGAIIFGVIMIAADVAGLRLRYTGPFRDEIPFPIETCIGVLFIASGVVMLIRVMRGKTP